MATPRNGGRALPKRLSVKKVHEMFADMHDSDDLEVESSGSDCDLSDCDEESDTDSARVELAMLDLDKKWLHLDQVLVVKDQQKELKLALMGGM